MRNFLGKAAVCAGVALMVALTALAVGVADKALSARMAELKARTIAALESMTGRTIRYGDISPSFFHSLQVRDLVILDEGEPARPLLSIRDIRVSYSLFRLLSGADPLAAIREVRILNTGFSLDVQRDKDVIDLLSKLARTGGESGALAVRITGANMRLSLTSSAGAFSLENLFFEIKAQPGIIGVSFRGLAGGTLSDGFTFRSNVRAEGSFDSALTSTDMTVHLLSLQSSILSAGAQTLQVIWKGPTLDIRKIRDRSPVALELHADLQKEEYTVTFQSERLRPDRLVTFAPPYRRYASWLKAPLTASGHVTWRARTQSLEYRVDASALLEDQLPFRDVALDTSFRGTEKEAFFEPLRLWSPEGTLEFEGSILFSSMFPSGLLTLANLRSGASQPLSATLAIERFPDVLRIDSTHMAIGSVGFDAFRMTLSPVADGATFSASATFTGAQAENTLSASGSMHFNTSLGKAASEGGLRALGAPRLALSVGLRNIPPDRLYHLAVGAGDLTREQKDIVALLASFNVSADLALSTDLSTVSMESAAVTITQPREPGTIVTFGLSADSAHISLRDFSGTWKGLSVHGGFEGRFAEGGQVAFTTDISYLGTAYAFSGRYAPNLGLTATGSYGLQVSALPLHNGTTAIQVKGDHFPLPLRGGPVIVSFDAAGLITPEGEWSVDFPSVTVYDLPILESRETVQASGKITQSRMELARLVVSDSTATLTGSAAADIVMPADLFAPGFLDELSVQGSASLAAAGGEAYTFHGGLKEGGLAVDFQFVGTPLLRLGKTAFSGSLSGSGALNGPRAAPRLDVTAALKDGKLGTDPISIAARLGYDGGVVSLSSASVVYLSHRLTDASGSLNMKAGTATFAGRYQGEYFADHLGMSVAVDGRFAAGDTAWPNVFEDGLLGKVSLTGITVAKAEFAPWNLNFHSQEGRLAFDGGPAGSVSGWVDPSLAFRVSLASPLPIAGTATGAIVGDQIKATVDFETIELSILNPMLNSASVPTAAGMLPLYHVSAGVATGALSIDGPVNDPDFAGQLDIVGAGLRSAYSADEVGPIRATLVFDGKTFHAAKTTAPVGAARLSALASFTIDHWAPISFDIALATEGSVPARLRGRFGRLFADGAGAGEMRMVGNDTRVVVTGRLLVSDCRIALGDTPTGKFVPEDVPTVVSVAVETGRRVEFYWPSLDLPVLRTTATPGGTIAVTYRGDTGAYTVKGVTGVQGGEIYYFDRSFIMKKGSITFDESQDEFDPWITTTAEVREWDPVTAEEVRITLNADGPFSRFSPRFTSDPPRSDAVLLAMIGAPIFNRAETQGLGLAALVYTDILSQTWILRPFEQKVRQVLNLDMFSIRTQVLQNLLAEKLFGGTANPLDNTSVSLGKYLGNDLFLEMLVRLQQPQIPGGSGIPGGGLSAAAPGLQPDMELTLEWTTPFFLLDWSFFPKHPESLFLTDNSLSFNWRYSY